MSVLTLYWIYKSVIVNWLCDNAYIKLESASHIECIQVQSPGVVLREVTSSIALANIVASCRWPRMPCGMSGHRYRVTAVEWRFVWRRWTKWNVVHRCRPTSSSLMRCYRDKPLAHKSLFIGIWPSKCTHVYVCIIYIHTMYNPKGTGAKLYSRPRTLASTGAKVPVAPVESAPMVSCNQTF